jgi:hypothetical protein
MFHTINHRDPQNKAKKMNHLLGAKMAETKAYRVLRVANSNKSNNYLFPLTCHFQLIKSGGPVEA